MIPKRGSASLSLSPKTFLCDFHHQPKNSLAMVKITMPERPWRRAVVYFSGAAFLTFLINLTFILWAMARRGETIKSGIGIVSEQSCSSTKVFNTGIHVVINVLSTILLAGSNYCLQCLIAPTRSQIDNAHRAQRWLDVGVPSLRNLRAIPWRKKIIWCLLSLSSLPLHLVYGFTVNLNNYVDTNWATVITLLYSARLP